MCNHCHTHTCSKGQVQASNSLQFSKQKPLPYSSVSWDFSFIHDQTSGKGVSLPNNCLFPRVAEAPMQTTGCLLSRAVSWKESKRKGEAWSCWNIYVVEDDLKTLENPRTWPTFRPRFRKEKREAELGRRGGMISASCLESRLQRSFISISPL